MVRVELILLAAMMVWLLIPVSVGAKEPKPELSTIAVHHENVLEERLGFGLPNKLVSNASKRKIINRWVKMYNSADISEADRIFTQDFVPHFPVPGLLGIVDRASYLNSISNPPVLNFHLTIEDLFGIDDELVIRFTSAATWPTGTPYTNTGIVFIRFQNGLIAEEWWDLDVLGVLEQVGQMPPTRPANAYSWSVPSSVRGFSSGPGQNASLACRAIMAAASAHDYEQWSTMASVHFIEHDPANWYVVDRDSEIMRIQAVGAAFPEMHVMIEDVVAVEDRVAIRMRLSGTQLGPLGSLPATNMHATWTASFIVRIAGGKMVESWWSLDTLGMLQQLTSPQ
jgi:hypothetical protein